MNIKKRINGIYIVSETACLIPGSGAFKHIEAGLIELNKYCNLKLVKLCCDPISYTNRKTNKKIKIEGKGNQNKFKQVIKWFVVLLKNHINLISHFVLIKKLNPDFIYERSSFLNYNGLIISKFLGIPHFYEVNGINALDNKKYFPNWLYKVGFFLEKLANKSTFGFYVGGLNYSFNIPINKYLIVQNGIEISYAKKFINRNNVCGSKIGITFIGHAMQHHRLDVLVDALNKVENPENIKLHLIGTNLENLKRLINPAIEVKYYGSLNHDDIAKVLMEVNIGIIPYALPYFSHVKAFLYGASKLTLVLPDSLNFRRIFKDEEVVFFKNGNSTDLVDKLNYLSKNVHLFQSLGNNIYSKILKDYTWDKIYELQFNQIIEWMGSKNKLK